VQVGDVIEVGINRVVRRIGIAPASSLSTQVPAHHSEVSSFSEKVTNRTFSSRQKRMELTIRNDELGLVVESDDAGANADAPNDSCLIPTSITSPTCTGRSKEESGRKEIIDDVFADERCRHRNAPARIANFVMSAADAAIAI